jgi:hypothetical protein
VQICTFILKLEYYRLAPLHEESISLAQCGGSHKPEYKKVYHCVYYVIVMFSGLYFKFVMAAQGLLLQYLGLT